MRVPYYFRDFTRDAKLRERAIHTVEGWRAAATTPSNSARRCCAMQELRGRGSVLGQVLRSSCGLKV